MLDLHNSKPCLKDKVSAIYARKLNNSLSEGDSESKKLRKLKKLLRRFFKSRKNKKTLIITLIALGVGTSLFNPDIRQGVILLISKLLSKCREFFTSFMSSDENINSQIESNKPNSNQWHMRVIGLAILSIIVAIKLLQNQEVEVEVAPPSITAITLSFIKQYRQPLGLLLFLASFPVAFTGAMLPWKCYLAGTLQFTGWQMATAVI